ncbi:MAG TPA: RNA methyltransferase [Pirellulales bacterium]|jgi:tRNA G18 (ribose-2'-O)-methylase SpoU|nr:RNA methyltransferase [Pirellulales bacterium]
MPRELVNSIDDPRLEAYRNLKDTNRTRWTGRFIAEGEKLVRRLFASDFAIESVLLSDRFERQLGRWVAPESRLFVVPDALVESLVGFNFHRGILACGRRKPAPRLDQLAPLGGRTTLVVCPNVQDPENLGGILRICAALGGDAVIVGSAAADPFSRRVLRVSMGAALRVPVRQSTNVAEDLRELAGPLGVQLAATVLDPTAEPLAQATRPERFALLLGSEGHGLSAELVELCQRKITIPMQAGTDSLNVAVTAGILLHHFACRGI